MVTVNTYQLLDILEKSIFARIICIIILFVTFLSPDYILVWIIQIAYLVYFFKFSYVF